MKTPFRLCVLAAILISALPVSNAKACAKKAPRYSSQFLWGAAFSAHQTEGVFGGGEKSDWYPFEHSLNADHQPNIANGDTADLADDFWDRYDEDFDNAKSIGLNAIRTSVAWEKIEPAPGVFSTAAIQHYRAIFTSMRAHGLKPMIALHHYVNPQWFDDAGGWTSPDAPKLFLAYASYVVDQLGDLCDLWITFNEPIVYVSEAYLSKLIPPRMGSLSAAYEAAFELGRAHRMVAAMIHAKQGASPDGKGPDGQLRGVGLANSLALYDPYDPSNAQDQQAASVLADLNDWAFIRGVLSDRLSFQIPAEVPNAQSFDRAFPADDLSGELAAGAAEPSLDWIGVNYYTRWLIRYDANSSIRADWITPDGQKSDNGWTIYPEGMERILRETATRFEGIPLVVTENGVADATDSIRPQFIRDHLASLDQAIQGGESGPPLDVRGYFHWSLLDNFEWLSGYQYRFGLFEVQYDNALRRVARPSADVYRDEIQKREKAQ